MNSLQISSRAERSSCHMSRVVRKSLCVPSILGPCAVYVILPMIKISPFFHALLLHIVISTIPFHKSFHPFLNRRYGFAPDIVHQIVHIRIGGRDIALLSKPFTEVKPYKACCAGDQYHFHALNTFLLFIPFFLKASLVSRIQ